MSEPVAGEPFYLLRDALYQLALPAVEQRRRLDQMVVTDELALDLYAALTSLKFASEEAGQELATDLVADLTQLMSLISAPAGDSLWNDAALDNDPRWAVARGQAGELLKRVESQS